MLLVEENEDHRKIFELFITDTGAEVTTAVDGLGAVQLFSENIYDIVFMDVDHPSIGGMEAVKEMRDIEAREERRSSTIIALAAHILGNHRGRK